VVDVEKDKIQVKSIVSDLVRDISNANYREWDEWEAFVAAAALLAATGVANAKNPSKMTDLIERTFRLLESDCGRVSRPGNDSYVVATAIWAKRAGTRCALPSTARHLKPGRQRNGKDPAGNAMERK
jgi:hypothetical protein